MTFETLITILIIENLNSWQSLLSDNQEWQHSQFLLCLMKMYQLPRYLFISFYQFRWSSQKVDWIKSKKQVILRGSSTSSVSSFQLPWRQSDRRLSSRRNGWMHAARTDWKEGWWNTGYFFWKTCPNKQKISYGLVILRGKEPF